MVAQIRPPTPRPTFDHTVANRTLYRACWAIEQAANGAAADINWLHIREAMTPLLPHIDTMTAVYATYLERPEGS